MQFSRVKLLIYFFNNIFNQDGMNTVHKKLYFHFLNMFKIHNYFLNVKVINIKINGKLSKISLKNYKIYDHLNY